MRFLLQMILISNTIAISRVVTSIHNPFHFEPLLRDNPTGKR